MSSADFLDAVGLGEHRVVRVEAAVSVHNWPPISEEPELLDSVPRDYRCARSALTRAAANLERCLYNGIDPMSSRAIIQGYATSLLLTFSLPFALTTSVLSLFMWIS